MCIIYVYIYIYIYVYLFVINTIVFLSSFCFVLRSFRFGSGPYLQRHRGVTAHELGRTRLPLSGRNQRYKINEQRLERKRMIQWYIWTYLIWYEQMNYIWITLSYIYICRYLEMIQDRHLILSMIRLFLRSHWQVETRDMSSMFLDPTQVPAQTDKVGPDGLLAPVQDTMWYLCSKLGAYSISIIHYSSERFKSQEFLEHTETAKP